MSNVEETIFDAPSGNVRGLVTAFVELKGKRKRIAHATLLTDRKPDVTLDIPKKIGVTEIAALSVALNDFASRVQSLTAGIQDAIA